MKGTEPNNSKSLGKNLEKMDQSVKQMLKLIKEDGDVLLSRRLELIAHVEEFYSMYQEQAQQYDYLTIELPKNISLELDMQGSENFEFDSEDASQYETPAQKLPVHMSGPKIVGLDMSFSSAGGSSGLSLNDGTGSFSTSSDSESESFDSSIGNYLDSPGNAGGKGVHPGAEVSSLQEKLQVVEEDNIDSQFKAGKGENCEEEVKRITNYEKELENSILKPKLPEAEISIMNTDVEKSESAFLDLEILPANHAVEQRDTKLRKDNHEFHRRQISEMQKQIADLEHQVLESSVEISRLVEELEVSKEKLKHSDEEIAKLKYEHMTTQQLQCQLEMAQEDMAVLQFSLDSERRHAFELQESIEEYKADVSAGDHKVSELKIALNDAHDNFAMEKAQLQSEIITLSEIKTVLDAKVKALELHGKSLEGEIRKLEAEKFEMKDMFNAQGISMQDEIDQLKEELAGWSRYVDVLNKKLDGLKHKYDMLMAEKDNANAKLDTLLTELSSRDNRIHQMEEQLSELSIEKAGVIADSDTMRYRVEELEKEVERQRKVIIDGAEEKREVIRQLCFSLEHFRSGYKELREAFIGHKRHAIMSS